MNNVNAAGWTPSSEEIVKQRKSFDGAVSFFNYHKILFDKMELISKWHPDCLAALDNIKSDPEISLFINSKNDLKKEIKSLEIGESVLGGDLARFSSSEFNPTKVSMNNCLQDNSSTWQKKLKSSCDTIIAKYEWSQELIEEPNGFEEKTIVVESEDGNDVITKRTSFIDTEEFKKEFHDKEAVKKKYEKSYQFCLNNDKVRRDVENYYKSRLAIENSEQYEKDLKFLNIYKATMQELTIQKDTDPEIKNLYNQNLLCSGPLLKMQDNLFKSFYYSKNLDGSNFRNNIWDLFNGNKNNFLKNIQNLEKVCLKAPKYISYVEEILKMISDDNIIKNPFCAKQMNDFPHINYKLLTFPSSGCGVLGNIYCSKRSLSFQSDEAKLKKLNDKYSRRNSDLYFPDVNIRNSEVNEKDLEFNEKYWNEKLEIVKEYADDPKINGVLTIANNIDFAKVAYACFPKKFVNNDWLHASLDYSELCDDFYAFNYIETMMGQPPLPTSGACSFINQNRENQEQKNLPEEQSESSERSSGKEK